MKKIVLFSFLTAIIFSGVSSYAQGTSRPSPPDTVTYNGGNGLTVTIAYSKPSIKDRKIGKDVAPYGKVWRTGANEATTFEVSRDVLVDGHPLPAGKYGLYTIPDSKKWTIIFNKTWKQWGTVYKEDQDALRIEVAPTLAPNFTEQMTFAIVDGHVALLWGNTQVSFDVK